MHSSTHAKMLRLEQNGPSYAALSSLLFDACDGSLHRQHAVEAALDPIIAALASGKMDAATAAEALADVRSQLHENIFSLMLVVWTTMMDALPVVREAEAAKMGVGKRSKTAAKVTPIREARHA